MILYNLEEKAFIDTFSKAVHITKLANNLDADQLHVPRWLILGQEIFKHQPKVLGQLNQIKHELMLVQMLCFFDVIISRFTNLTWAEFKKLSHKIEGLHTLKLGDTTKMSLMSEKQKTEIANIMIPIKDCWRDIIDQLITDAEDRRYTKSAIYNSCKTKQISSPTEQLLELVYQTYPFFTVKQFFEACNKCGFNGTLKDIKDICNEEQQKLKPNA